MKTNKIQWKRISEGEELPCDSLLMRYDGTITIGTCAGVKAGQDAYYLPVEELRTLPKEKSEDEKAIKNIIESLKVLISRIEDDAAAPNAKAFLIEEIEKQIAWLERQDEHKKFLDSIQVGDKVTRNEDGVLVNLSQLNRVAKKDEKQGEKRTKLVDFDLNANDSDLQEVTYFIPNGYHAEIIGDKVVIKKGEQKPVDKVEPKFKAGKWYLCVRDFWGKFVRFDKGHAYYCGLNGCLKEFDSGAHIAIDEKLYDYFNLWTIQDAKDGDILVYGVNQRPFIFKGLLDPYHPNCPVAYCGIDTEGNCYVSKDDTWWTDCNVMPATKEQRETLEKAITDDGYRWDAEKKELKKIEEEPENFKKQLESETDDLVIDYITQKPTEWSEEDKDMLGMLLEMINYASDHYQHDDKATDIKAWVLKSLKDRVQPKQEWSEEDEKKLSTTIAYLLDVEDFPLNAEKCINWLKELKNRVLSQPFLILS